jgi:membrane peptidoglycan carboxypeptidase
LWTAGLCSIAGLAWFEVSTSALQAQLLAAVNANLSYRITSAAKPSQLVAFPTHGPLDERLGYTRIPKFRHMLERLGFHVVETARASAALVTLTHLGIPPPFPEPDTAGFVIEGVGGQTLFAAAPEPLRFESYDEIPPLVVQALSFIEDRRVDDLSAPSRNPAVDWARLGKAVLVHGGRTIGLPLRNEGGSTLAVQLEKYRHSDDGLTSSGVDKIQQILAASLRAYQDGPDTREARRRIVLEYLNTMPLAAAPGIGELHGLKEGLRVWFNADPEAVCEELKEDTSQASAGRHGGSAEDRAWAFKHVLALLCAVRAPTEFLLQRHEALEQRTAGFTTLLEREGVIDSTFAREVRATPLVFASARRTPARFVVSPERKAPNLVRNEVLRLLGTKDFYELDRLHLFVESTLDVQLQNAATALFDSLADPEYVATHGLVGEHLLDRGDPAGVRYSLLLYESAPQGNLVRVHADNLERPLDLNDGVKLELGSTAKLRTLAHYLDVLATLHDAFASMPENALWLESATASDRLTEWAAQTIADHPGIGLEEFLDRGLDREYSASPGERFFTGGGVHQFHNFDPTDDRQILTVRQATVRSTNLAYIRLMRDLVQYHAARLPYDADEVLTNRDDPTRRRLLEEETDDEARAIVAIAYRDFHGIDEGKTVRRILGPGPVTLRRLSMLYFAWHPGASADSLAQWLRARTGEPAIATNIARLMKRAYGKPGLLLADYGYLLDTHPVRLWCAGRLAADPAMSRDDLMAESEPTRNAASAWVLETRHHGAQNRRLRTRIERDAFEHMAPAWRRLGFPFQSLVPSYATAIGSSADRPTALADLMGIIVNDGLYRPARCLERLRFASETPYYTALEAAPESAQRVMPAAAARVLRGILAQVVERGTAQRIRGAFDENGDTLAVGGKTGSGDNRYLAPNGRPTSSSRVSRTAAFTFYLGDRYFGVLTASVEGPRALRYGFTSSLPLAVLKLLAPAIEERLDVAQAGQTSLTARAAAAP